MALRKSLVVCKRCGGDLPAEGAACPTCDAPESEADALFAGKYRLDKALGRGGMGVVHLATDISLDRQVALKLLHASLASEPEIIQRFEKEARMMARLEHPNLVPIYAVDRSDGVPFIAMKFLEGRTLSQSRRDRGHPWTAQELTPILRQLCAGLAFMHGKGFVHRDLKPGNLFLAPDGHATILDLGIARDVGSTLTRPGLPMGTPHYMSPEQTETTNIDSRSDLYSMGVILFEALTGRLPFMGENEFELMRAHRDSPPPDAAQLVRTSPEIGALLIRALAKKPGDRYQTAKELADAWEVAAGAAVSASTVPDGPPVARHPNTATPAHRHGATATPAPPAAIDAAARSTPMKAGKPSLPVSRPSSGAASASVPVARPPTPIARSERSEPAGPAANAPVAQVPDSGPSSAKPMTPGAVRLSAGNLPPIVHTRPAPVASSPGAARPPAEATAASPSTTPVPRPSAGGPPPAAAKPTAQPSTTPVPRASAGSPPSAAAKPTTQPSTTPVPRASAGSPPPAAAKSTAPPSTTPVPDSSSGSPASIAAKPSAHPSTTPVPRASAGSPPSVAAKPGDVPAAAATPPLAPPVTEALQSTAHFDDEPDTGGPGLSHEASQTLSEDDDEAEAFTAILPAMMLPAPVVDPGEQTHAGQPDAVPWASPSQTIEATRTPSPGANPWKDDDETHSTNTAPGAEGTLAPTSETQRPPVVAPPPSPGVALLKNPRLWVAVGIAALVTVGLVVTLLPRPSEPPDGAAIVEVKTPPEKKAVAPVPLEPLPTVPPVAKTDPPAPPQKEPTAAVQPVPKAVEPAKPPEKEPTAAVQPAPKEVEPTKPDDTPPPVVAPVQPKAQPPRPTSGELRIVALLGGKSAGAKVAIDGAEKGYTPLVIQLPTGKHEVQLTPPSGAPLNRSVNVVGGSPTVLRVDLPN